MSFNKTFYFFSFVFTFFNTAGIYSLSMSEAIPQQRALNHVKRAQNLTNHFKLNTSYKPSEIISIPCTGLSQSSIEQFSKKLMAEKKVTVPLSQIIEWNLASNDNFFNHSLHGMKSVANPTRKAMALKWVRNASTRIFNDPSRCFLEIVVNSFDSMFPTTESVGKFGMGFFSILTFLDLAETDGTTINITTSVKNSDGKLFSYKMTINKDKELNDIILIFEVIDLTKLGSTGTTIDIVPKNPNKSFSNETLENIYRYLHHLGFYRKGVIDLSIERNKKIVKEKIGSPTNANLHVTTKIALTGKKLSTEDKGTGIPLDVSITKLLVPSSSSKGKAPISISEEQKKALSTVERPKLVNFKGKRPENKNRSHFLIEINGVLVVIVPNKEDGIEKQIVDSSGNVIDILISMPQLTQLTLARNEIYINPNGLSFEETYLKTLIDLTINHVISNLTVSEDVLLKNQLLISALYNGFAYWEKQTASEHLNGYFTNYIKTVLSKILETRPEILPVHPIYFKTVSAICKKANVNTKECFLLPLDPTMVSFSYSKLEQFLKEYYLKYFMTMKDSVERNLLLSGIKQELIAGRIIFFVPDELLTVRGCILISDLGLRQSLFVPVSFLKESLGKGDIKAIKEFLSNKIISRYTQTILNPFGVDSRNLPQKVFLLNIPNKHTSLKQADYKLFVEGDEKLANEFVKEYFDQIKCLKTNVFSNGYVGACIVTCYDQNCKNSGHYHSKYTNQLGHNHFSSYINSSYKFVTVEQISEIFVEDLNGIKSILNGQRDAVAGIKKDGYEDYEFPTAICNFLKNAVFFDENTNEAFSFDYDQLIQVFIKEFKTNEHIKKIAIFEKVETRYSEKNTKLINEIKPIIIDLIQKNKLLKRKLNSVEVLNFLFTNLLIDNRLLRENEDGSFIVEYCSNSDLWPLKVKTLQTVENLFLSLISIMNYSFENFQVYVKPILGNIIKVNSSDLDKTVIKSAMAERIEELPISLEYQNTLSSITDLNIPAVLLNSLVSYFKVRDLEVLPTGHKKVYFEFRNSMLNLYKQFFKVSDNEFSYNYGQEHLSSVRALNPTNDVTCENFVQFLSKLKSNLYLYNKLVEFQIIDFAFQTDKNLRAIDLMNKQFYVPSMLSNTPLSVLAYMSETLHIHENIIRIIIELSRTPSELMYISYLICTAYARSEKIQTMLKSENREVENNIRLIIRNFIQEKIDQDRINQIYNGNRNRLNFSERLKFVSNEPITEPILDYLLEIYTNAESSFATKASFIAKGIVVSNTQSFTLKQLINAHCSGTGLDNHLDPKSQKELLEMLGFSSDNSDEQLKALINKINSCDKEIDIGKIEQSVEAGSEKSPVCGSVTEALQNSADVIKSFLNAMQKDSKEIQESLKLRKANNKTIDDLTRIEYSLDTVPCETDPSNTHVCLTMRDYIGFSTLKSLMTDFLLPDYSNKKPELGNVGDMGNGSFKIYQQAAMVSLFTRPINDPNKVYWLTIVPIRNKLTNRVEDLSITIRNVTGQVPQKLFGTSIKMVFLPEEKSKNELNLIYIKDFLTNNVGAANISLPFDKKIQIFMNANDKRILLNKPTNLIFEKTCPISGKPKFRVYERSSNFLQSFVTTGGVPFRTLNSLGKHMNLLPAALLQEMSFGFIVDLDVNTYEPVQSRTLVQMNAANIRELRQTLLDAYYIVGLRKGIKNSNFFEKVFTHFGSKVTLFSQLEITASENEAFKKTLEAFLDNKDSSVTFNQESFFTFYKPSWAHKSFFEYMQDAYKTLVPLINDATAKNDKLISDWHDSNKKDLMTIATSKDIKAVEELKGRLQKEFDEIKAKCAKNIKDIWDKWKTQLGAKSDNEFTGILEKNVVFKWLDHKISNIIHNYEYKEMNIPITLAPQDQQKTDYNWEIYKKNIIVMNNLMKHSLMSYARLYFAKLGIKDANFNSRLTKANFFYNPMSNTAAVYYVNLKLIEVNIKYFLMADYFELLIKVLTNDIAAVKLDKAYNQLFTNNPGTDATITHELEHVRRRDSHGGAHSPAHDAEGNLTNYPGCANSFSKKAQELGLLEDWSKDLNDFLKRNKVDLKSLLEDMNYTLSALRKMEMENKNLLMQRLGYLMISKL